VNEAILYLVGARLLRFLRDKMSDTRVCQKTIDIVEYGQYNSDKNKKARGIMPCV